ncbi:oligosaccharide flippase family protein [Flavobacterium solisilvae]|uniref:Oligosaccharide flippase family protein n=1 Tax=Flavobacterium solisilvae TaxID=1852019 RepID=A0ABX1QVY7_9FLAO|nr:oligosaccharide flippase family protein [Flavobacterium solisilvae]NMH25349.1 oligosaccharide flippase family protein [Flavobacterium solisilvae]
MSKLIDKFKNISDINKNIINSGFWILLGSFLSNILLLIATVLITDFVPKQVYGEFGIIKSTINMFSVFAGLGLGLTATKYIAQYKNEDKQKTSRIIGLSNVFSVLISVFVLIIFLVFSKSLSYQINAPHLDYELKIAGILLFFTALNGVQKGILSGFEKFKIIAINSIIASVISLFCQIIGAKIYGLDGIIIGFGVNFFILYILNYFSINKITNKEYQFRIFSKQNFKEINIIWKFSIPAVLSGLMVSPVTWLTNKFLVSLPKGYEQMAIFDIAMQWRTTVLFIPVALCQIALPMLATAKNENYFQILKKNILLNFVVAFIIVMIVIAFIPFILSFYGDEYRNAVLPMTIMLVTTILIAINNVVGQAIASLDKMWLGFIFNMLWGVIILLLSYYYLILRKEGVIGLCYSYLISYISHTIIQYSYLVWIMKFKKNKLNLLT